MLTFFLFSCDSKTNPVSGNEFFDLNIYFNGLYGTSIIFETVTLKIERKGIVQEYSTNSGTVINITDIISGGYQLKPKINNFIIIPESLYVSVPKSRIAYFWGITVEKYQALQKNKSFLIFGTVISNEGDPVSGVTITLKNISSGKEEKRTTDERGCYSIELSKESGSYTLIPSKEYYQYSFFPPQVSLPSPEILSLRDFTAQNTGMKLHSIQGRVVDSDGKGVVAGMWLNGIGDKAVTISDSLGVFRFSGLADGDYSVQYSGFDAWKVTPDSLRIIVKGADVLLPDFIATYIGPTWHGIRGRIVDQNGRGISGAEVRFHPHDNLWDSEIIKTDSKGVYEEKMMFYVVINGIVTLTPFKAGCTFSPDSAAITLTRMEGTFFSDIITPPDFIGTDYTLYTPSDYFPLRSGVTWTYARTINSASPVDFSAHIGGTTTSNGYNYSTFNPSGPAGLEYFRIEGNSVRAVYGKKDVELLRFGVTPGVKWDVGKVSDLYPTTGEFHGLESVTAPAGTWPDCLKYEVRTKYGETTYETCTLWFARGVGMVKSEKTLVNFGSVKETIVDVLK